MKPKFFRISIIFVLIIVIYFIHSVSKMNVLDRIYYAVTHGYYQPVNKALDVYGYDWEWFNEYERIGAMPLRLIEDSLSDNYFISLSFVNMDKKELNIYVENNLSSEGTIELFMSYDVKKRELYCYSVEINLYKDKEIESLEYPEDKEEIMGYLQEYNITEEDVQGYLDYVLYDVLVQPWVEAHGGIYAREKEKIERCLIDNSCEIYK